MKLTLSSTNGSKHKDTNTSFSMCSNYYQTLYSKGFMVSIDIGGK